MKIDVLISTMNLINVDKLIKNMNIISNYIVINQTKESKINNANIYNYNEIGLSKSRNRAIGNSKSDVCIIADDDVIYKADYLETVTKAYEKYPDADIIIFGVESLNTDRPIKKIKGHRVNQINAMRIISSQITFKRESIIKNNIKFDENFGAGSKYDRAEETIFLCDALRKKLKIVNISDIIASVKQENSTWFNGFNKDFFTKQGACFYRMNKKIYLLLIIQYAIRKYSLYKNRVTLKEAIYNMLNGANTYKKEIINGKKNISNN